MNNPFLRAYEFEKRFELYRLRITLEKAEKAYETKQPEVIDLCKCALETICKAILDEKKLPYVDRDGEYFDLPRLIKTTLSSLGCGNDQIRGGISSIVYGICEMRNKEAIAGHGLNGKKPLIGRRDIDIFVAAFSHVVDTLLCLQKVEALIVSDTTMSFYSLEESVCLEQFNEALDQSVRVDYSIEDGLLFVDGKDIRPSALIYQFDRESYAERLKRYQQSNNIQHSKISESDKR